MNTRKAKMIRLAAQTLGSYQALAQEVGTTTIQLAEWIGGRTDPPDSAYFKALDIVAKGPFNRPA
jgi:hypothetical protein